MAKKDKPAVSPAETEILRLVWKLKSATVKDICEALPKSRDVNYATVQTLLRRLEKKGYVEHELKGKAHVFKAAIEPEAVIKRTVGEFVERLFGGDALPLMLHLADQTEMEPEDIKRLKKLIAKKSK